MLRPSLLAIGVAAAVASSLPIAAQPAGKTPQPNVDDVISVTGARRREEAVQEVPIPVSVVDGELITEAGAFNVNRIKELIPSVQLYSSNPRNTGVNIRGLGSPFGLTNDGIEPGVGYYVDGVLYARPAATTLDFIDVERVEVLRGPQGTLFGKNTTAGAILVTTRKASFTPEYDFELGYGDDDFVQAKGSISGPLGDKVAGRLSLTSTQRDGILYNVATQEKVNDLDNIGLRTQLLVTPNERMDVTFVLDYTNQEPNGYAQVFAGAVPTQRSAYRQFDDDRRGSRLCAAERRSVRPPHRSQHAVEVRQRDGRRFCQHRRRSRSRHVDLDDGLAFLELGSVERSRLPRPAGRHAVAGAVDARAGDAGDSLGRRSLGEGQRRVRLLRLRSETQHGSGSHRASGRGPLSILVDGA